MNSEGGNEEFDEEFEDSVGMCSKFSKSDSSLYDREGIAMTGEGYWKPLYGREWQVMAPGVDTMIMSNVTLDPIPNHSAYPQLCGDYEAPDVDYPESCDQILNGGGGRNGDGDSDGDPTETCPHCQDLWDPVLVCNCEYDASLVGCDEIEDIYDEDNQDFLDPDPNRKEPTPEPSESPSISSIPSNQPSSDPSVVPSNMPSLRSSSKPSPLPSEIPTNKPSNVLSSKPSSEPSKIPTNDVGSVRLYWFDSWNFL